MNIKTEWSRQQTLKLIKELNPLEFLYKVTHPHYLKNYKKQDGLEEIAVSLKEVKPSVTAAEVKKKIKILQQQISQEKKMRAATRSGMSADDIYVSKLWCFNDLSFLLNANDEIRGQSNLEINMSDNTYSGTESSHNPRNVKRSRLEEAAALRQTANKSMELVTNVIKKRSVQEESKEEIFCKMLCSELKELKLVETYGDVTTEMLLLVRRAKAAERKKLSWQVPRKAADPCSSSQSSLQSSSLHSSVSSLDKYLDDSFHDSTLVLEEGKDCVQSHEETRNNNAELVEIQSVEIIPTNDILQQALECIFEGSD